MKHNFFFSLAAVMAVAASIFTASCGNSENPEKTAAMERLQANLPLYDSTLQALIERDSIPMIDLVFYSNGASIHIQKVNPAVYSEDEAGKTHVFQAASLSKVIFSYIVMQMVENGEIDLNTPLCQYTDISRFEQAGDSINTARARKITAAMVLNHRTGLSNWAAGPSSDEWPTSTITFSVEPDSCYGYSGEGMAFLQRAVEAIKGRSIDVIAKEMVFEPLGLEHTAYCWLDEYDSLAVSGYKANFEDRGQGRHPRSNVAYTLRTNAEDYAKFLTAIATKYYQPAVNGNVANGLTEEYWNLFLTPNPEIAKRYWDEERACDSTMYWCNGIGLEKNANQGNVYWHWGDNGSFKALFMYVPARGEFFIYFTNSIYGHEIVSDITKLFFEDSTPFAVDNWINL